MDYPSSMGESHVTSALLASVGKERIGVIVGIEPAWAGALAAGPAFTVQGSPGDNLALHQAIDRAAPGSVIVANVGGGQEIAHCGDVLALAASERGIAGMILDGAIRDRASIAELRFPVFHRGTSPRGPEKRHSGAFGGAISLLGTVVNGRDFVCADDDGIVIVPHAQANAVIADAMELDRREEEFATRIKQGISTLQLYGLARHES